MAKEEADGLAARLVTCTIEMDGDLVVVEHVPAQVDLETGERFFSPQTVERLQQIVGERRAPTRTIQAPVFDFAA